MGNQCAPECLDLVPPEESLEGSEGYQKQSQSQDTDFTPDFTPDPSHVGSVTFDQHMDVRNKLQISEQRGRDLEQEIAKLRREVEDRLQAHNKIDIIRLRLEDEKSDLLQRQERLEANLSREREESGQQRMELARMRREADDNRRERAANEERLADAALRIQSLEEARNDLAKKNTSGTRELQALRNLACAECRLKSCDATAVTDFFALVPPESCLKSRSFQFQKLREQTKVVIPDKRW